MNRKKTVLIMGFLVFCVMIICIIMCVFHKNGEKQNKVNEESSVAEESTGEEANGEENGLIIQDGVLIGYNGALEHVVIPEGVTEIGEFAFSSCDSLISIDIPEGVTKIGQWAFQSCTKLNTVKIASSVTDIGRGAFAKCTNLVSVNIPDGITEIKESTFLSCKSLDRVQIPASINHIGSQAFTDTAWIKIKQKENPLVIVNNILIDGSAAEGNIVILDGVVRINAEAFASCENINRVTIPDSVTSIGEYAFWNCSNLSEIHIPDSVTQIGRRAFHDTPWMETRQKENPLVIVNDVLIDGTLAEGEAVIPQGVIRINDGAFWCGSLSSVEIPSSVQSIGKEAFYACNSLISAEIEEGMISIEDKAFSWCEKLEKAVLPSSIKEIGEGVFSIQFEDGDEMLAVTLYAPNDSYIYKYAQEQGLKVEMTN